MSGRRAARLVGTAANVLTDLSDLDGCKNAAGKRIGIPNLAAVASPFQDAVTKAIANAGTLDRQMLSTAMSKETAFDAEGITGATNIAAHTPLACIAVSQVRSGQWKRVFPARAGTFDCNPANIATIKPNLAQ